MKLQMILVVNGTSLQGTVTTYVIENLLVNQLLLETLTKTQMDGSLMVSLLRQWGDKDFEYIKQQPQLENWWYSNWEYDHVAVIHMNVDLYKKL